MPRLIFPGGALIGDAAGFLNVPKIKGTHAAMKSGMLAAEAVAEALAAGRPPEPAGLAEKVRASWLWDELHRVRNIRPAFAQLRPLWRGRLFGARHLRAARPRAVDAAPSRTPTTRRLLAAAAAPHITYPSPDGVLTFDRLSSVFISNTNHEENQPVAPQAARPGEWRSRSTGTVSQPRDPLLPGRRL